MLDSLRGTVLEVGAESAVIEAGGIGLRVKLPAGSTGNLARGAEARVYCYLLLRDEQFHLYGFETDVERDLFAVLLSVSGLGPEKARALLGGLSPGDVVEAVNAQEPRRFQGVKGIGTRLAQRLALELKGKLDAFQHCVGQSGRPAVAGDRRHADLTAALIQLGYPRPQSEAAATATLDANPDGTLEDLVKAALRSLLKPS